MRINFEQISHIVNILNDIKNLTDFYDIDDISGSFYSVDDIGISVDENGISIVNINE